MATKTWETWASDLGYNELKKRVQANLEPSSEILQTFAKPSDWAFTVLDLGCGLGRNLRWMADNTDWALVGFDTDAMLARFPHEDLKCKVTSNWSYITADTFDVVYADRVLQHIETVRLNRMLSDLSEVAPQMIVVTWGRSDEGEDDVKRLMSHPDWDLVSDRPIERSHRLLEFRNGYYDSWKNALAARDSEIADGVQEGSDSDPKTIWRKIRGAFGSVRAFRQTQKDRSS